MGDINYKSYGHAVGLRLLGIAYPDPGVNPKDYADIQKFSLCTDVRSEECEVMCGKENCCDAVRGAAYEWVGCRFITRPPSKGAFTIKGSIDGWRIESCIFDGHGDEFDIEVGQFDNYWYLGRKPTRRGVVMNCLATDDRPIKIVVWDGEPPVVSGSNVKVTKVPKTIWLPYFCFRYIQIRIHNLFSKNKIITK
jgi:hypothetical protein